MAFATQVFNKINFRNIKGDMFGGLTAAVIALPMALAFGVASGAADAGAPAAGLYGAVLVGLFAALFGGTPTLISEPTGPMTVVTTAVIAHLTTTNPENGLAMAFTVVMMAGVLQIIFGLLRFGKYITMMPYNVISGFMSGIGIILIILQIGPFLGQASPKGGVVGTIQNIPNLLTSINPIETGLAALTVAILFLVPAKVKKFVPPPLLALVVGTVISVLFFSDAGIRRIGEIPTGLPSLQLPYFTPDQLQLMVADATVLAMLGCIDALLTSVVADSLTRTQHNSDKELIGQGLGNLASGLFGGLPGAGATMGTVVNINTGARSALSGITRAFILMIVVLGAGSLTAQIPMAVLAGIALQVGIKIIDWGFLKRAHNISWKSAMIMYGVIGLTVFVDLIAAVGIGVFVANVLTIDRLTQIKSEDVKAITDADDAIILDNDEKELLDRAEGRILLFHLSGPMIFGVSKAISRQHTLLNNYEVLIVDLSEVPHMGVTSALAIENAIQETVDTGRHVFLVGATGSVKRRLEKLGVLEIVPSQNMLVDRKQALVNAVALVTSDVNINSANSKVKNQTPSSFDNLQIGQNQ
ncbi:MULTISPECIES: SulP family inorganic anion transporter [Okeania]|uniref:SulP family inorganic anion transporter n=1 Tax=Okeania hirsuta TaxID=1458930 RepID=A0A3N6RB58_9CYAN|nr:MULTISPECIES: SulP family inorganic anion transporter [Okeania]NES87745.1 SulP family inorganic anion transporter [Okeania sp. SIO2B9]RQH33480.1 SulP family inorganic anion transporter [Okeania hirsuta]